MNFNSFFPWIAQIFFFLAFWPQIILNFKRKSTHGLSDFLFIGYFYGYSFYMLYAYCLNLPLAHKIMIPLGFFAILILIFQRFYYSESKDNGLRLFFKLSILFFAILTIFAIKHSSFIGHISGWLMMFIFAIYQFPQIFKNYKNKSIQGLSFGLVSIIGFGNFTEFVVALFLGLPAQTYINNLNGILVYAVYLRQFLKFK